MGRDLAGAGESSARRDGRRQRHSQLSEMVARHVRESIVAGELKAPDFIRTERLAEELGVSPTPVREALMTLQSEGVVRWQPRRGFRVVPLTVQDVEDIFAVQAYIAGELAARAAVCLDNAEVEQLRVVQTALEDAAARGDGAAVDRFNHEIHRTINRASGSGRLEMLLGVTVKYVPLGFFENVPGWSDASMNDHGPIFDALENRDATTARHTMEAHITHVGSLLVRYLASRGTTVGDGEFVGERRAQ